MRPGLKALPNTYRQRLQHQIRHVLPPQTFILVPVDALQGGLLFNQQRKKRTPKTLLQMGEFVKEYLQQSSIHCMGYLARPELTGCEKILWFIVLVTAFVFCVVISLQSVHRFNHKSTIIGLETGYNYWNTTLPSLTVCPTHRIDEHTFSDWARHNHIPIDHRDELFNFIEQLANTTYYNSKDIPEYPNVDSILSDLHIGSEDYMSLIFNLTVDLSTTRDVSNRVRGLEGDRLIETRLVLTEYGLCYISNTQLGAKYSARYFIHGEYPENEMDDRDAYIKNIFVDYYVPEVFYQIRGMKGKMTAYAHSPYEPMRVDVGYEFVTDVSVMFITESEEMLADDDMAFRSTPEQRKCLFEHESNLANFPIYTKNFCLQQCRIDAAMKFCNCIPHFYPNLRNPKPVCEYRKLKACFSKHGEFLLKLYRPNSKMVFPCNCIAGCRNSFVRIIDRKPMTSMEMFAGGLIVATRFMNVAHRRYRRQIIFTITDLIVSVGGTAGLFLGFSVLGLIEFVYYFTVRLFLRLLCGTNERISP